MIDGKRLSALQSQYRLLKTKKIKHLHLQRQRSLVQMNVFYAVRMVRGAFWTL